MNSQEDKKISPMTIDHWTIKFEKAILILLKNGISSDVLIKKIKAVENEKNS
jgi:hypothetical protein